MCALAGIALKPRVIFPMAAAAHYSCLSLPRRAPTLPVSPTPPSVWTQWCSYNPDELRFEPVAPVATTVSATLESEVPGIGPPQGLEVENLEKFVLECVSPPASRPLRLGPGGASCRCLVRWPRSFAGLVDGQARAAGRRGEVPHPARPQRRGQRHVPNVLRQAGAARRGPDPAEVPPCRAQAQAVQGQQLPHYHRPHGEPTRLSAHGFCGHVFGSIRMARLSSSLRVSASLLVPLSVTPYHPCLCLCLAAALLLPLPLRLSTLCWSRCSQPSMHFAAMACPVTEHRGAYCNAFPTQRI